MGRTVCHRGARDKNCRMTTIMGRQRVLVTGSAGFIGRHVIPLLQAKGYEVHGAGRRDNEKPGSAVVYHRVDLLDASETRSLIQRIKPQHLIHLAWNAKPGEFW